MTQWYRWRTWQQDPLFQKVIRNSGTLLSSNTISTVLTSFQGILAAILLGPSGYGALGMIIMFASSINRLFSFRMAEVVIKFAGQELAQGNKAQASAIIKLAALAESLTSVFAYGVLVLLAPMAARYILKDPSTISWILFYGLALLANLVTETSTALLQIAGRYKGQAILNLGQSVITASLILGAFVFKAGLGFVLFSYLTGKLIFGIGIAWLALNRAGIILGDKWYRASLAMVKNRRAMAGFAISTNLSGTLNMVIRDSELLWVGYFLSSLEAGYYKFALAMMNIIIMPITPLITTTYPEISRQVAMKEWGALRKLLSRTSILAAIWTAACGLGLLVIGRPILSWLKDGVYLPSFPAIMILLLGFGVGNILFWNRPLLLSLGLPNEPLKIGAAVGIVKTALMFWLVRPFGYIAQAALLSGYFIVSMGLVVKRGLKELRRVEASALEGND